MNSGAATDGAMAARTARPVTANPHAPDTRLYYEWHADWHGEMAAIAAAKGRRDEEGRLSVLAKMYRRMGYDVGVL